MTEKIKSIRHFFVVTTTFGKSIWVNAEKIIYVLPISNGPLLEGSHIRFNDEDFVEAKENIDSIMDCIATLGIDNG